MEVTPGCEGCAVVQPPLSSQCCKDCGRCVATRPDGNGRCFHVGQVVYFFNVMGIVSKGFIVEVELTSNMVTLRYSDRTWSCSKYDETHPVTSIAETIDELSDNQPSRSRPRILPEVHASSADLALNRGQRLSGPKRPIKATGTSVVFSESSTSSSKSSEVFRGSLASTSRGFCAGKRPERTNNSILKTNVASHQQGDDSGWTASAPSDADYDKNGWWVTDIVSELLSPENEHDSCPFDEKKRAESLFTPVQSFESVDELLCRVRFVEGCSRRVHRGLSRLDRCQQRALCHALYQNARGSVPDEQSFSAKALLLRRPKHRRAPLGESSQQPSGISDMSENDDVPPGVQNKLRWSHSIADCHNSDWLTVTVLEKVLWCLPRSEAEFFQLPGTEHIQKGRDTQLVLSVIEVIELFLESRSIIPKYSFIDALNKNVNASRRQLNLPSAEIEVPYYCPLCPSEPQGHARATRVYSQAEFNKMRPSFPLTFEQFRYAMNIVYDFFGGREAVEGHHGVHGVAHSEAGRTMYGGVNENLVEEIAQRTGLNRHDMFTDIGHGIGQVCLQLAATIGCRCCGVENVKERFEASNTLLFNLDGVLKEAGIEGNPLASLIEFSLTDFMEHQEWASRSDVIFFNNYAAWFDSDNPDKASSGNIDFCKRLVELPVGGQVVVLNELLEAKNWLAKSSFPAPLHSTSTWKASEDDNNCKMTVTHYRKLSNFWKCRYCGAITPNAQFDKCSRGCSVRITRDRSLKKTQSRDSIDSERVDAPPKRRRAAVAGVAKKPREQARKKKKSFCKRPVCREEVSTEDENNDLEKLVAEIDARCAEADAEEAAKATRENCISSLETGQVDELSDSSFDAKKASMLSWVGTAVVTSQLVDRRAPSILDGVPLRSMPKTPSPTLEDDGSSTTSEYTMGSYEWVD